MSDVPKGRPRPQGTGIFSCVVDDHPRFHLDALRWFASLTRLAGVDPGDLVVHVTGQGATEVLDHLQDKGVTVRFVDPFDERSPHCNKISGALALAAERVDGLAVLCDTDIAVLEDPREVDVPGRSMAAKPVDAPCPPLEVLQAVFGASGVAAPPTVPLPWGQPESTLAGNCNGGLYLVPGPLLATLAHTWERWARWLLDGARLPAEWAIYVDQVAMALALADEEIHPVALDPAWNTPTHDLSRLPADAAEPRVLHYHQELDDQGRIQLTGARSVDGRIHQVNAAIDDVWRSVSPVSTYWEWHHRSAPPPRAAPAAGPSASDGAAWLSVLVDAAQAGSILDVGCGDGRSTLRLVADRYTGLDPSAEALRRTKALRPGAELLLGTLVEHPVSADMTVCLDVLPYHIDRPTYVADVGRLWESARRVLVVSGYESPPVGRSPLRQFHEPLSVTLQSAAPLAELYPLRKDGALTTFAALRPPPDRHPRDYGPATLAPLVGRHPDPLRLAALHLHAWRTLRFYPDHAPRLWEYPVVAGLIEGVLEPGSRVADIGAGVSPLAPFLSDLGYLMDTVDSSPVRRTWPPKPDWNEWEYLDYAAVGLAERSWNCTFAELPASAAFDGAYSVSVIEHLPARQRRALLSQLAMRVRPGGVLVLTIDLVRGADDLWNRSRGVEVEKGSKHGTLQDVMAESTRAGFDTFSVERVREWGGTAVDIGMLAMRRRTAPASTSLDWRIAGHRLASLLHRPARPRPR